MTRPGVASIYRHGVIDAFAELLDTWAKDEGLELQNGELVSLVEFLASHSIETMHVLEVINND